MTKTKKKKIKPIHLCLIQLNQIFSGLVVANQILRNYFIPSQAQSMLLLFSDMQSVTGKDRLAHLKLQANLDIAFETMVMKLDQLFEIHSYMSKCFKESRKLTLIKTLKDEWREIKKNEPLIRTWRNCVVGHAKKQAINYPTYKDIDPDFIESQKKILKTSTLASFYLFSLFINTRKELSEALRIPEDLVKTYQGINMTEFYSEKEKEELSFVKELNKKLGSKKFKKITPAKYNKIP